MNIRKRKLDNHPVLGNLELDFTSKTGKTVNTVIIAGENGSGKSALLNVIFQLSISGVNGSKRNETRFCEIELSEPQIEILKNNIEMARYFATPYLNNIFNIKFDYNFPSNWDQVQITGKLMDGSVQRIPGQLFSHTDTGNAARVIFSDVEINFT